MRDRLDPVDNALDSLRSHRWPGDDHNIQLEEKLMRDFASNRSTFRLGGHRLWIAALAIFVLGGAGFAAAGGVGLIKSWLVTTEINGEVVDVREVVPDEDGNASFTIPVEPAEGDNEITLTLEGEGSGDGGTKTVSVTMEGGEGVANVEIEQEEVDDE